MKFLTYLNETYKGTIKDSQIFSNPSQSELVKLIKEIKNKKFEKLEGYWFRILIDSTFKKVYFWDSELTHYDTFKIFGTNFWYEFEEEVKEGNFIPGIVFYKNGTFSGLRSDWINLKNYKDKIKEKNWNFAKKYFPNIDSWIKSL